MIVSEKKIKVTNPETVAKVLHSVLRSEIEVDREKEHFWVIGLNGNNVIQYIELVSLGIATKAIIHPREVFRFAISKGTVTMIIAHNHPSGSLDPSDEDKKITEQLVKSGDILGIQILDHLLLGNDDEFFSFHDNDLI